MPPNPRLEAGEIEDSGARYHSELPEDLRLYDATSPVCRYYHLTRRAAVLEVLENATLRLKDQGFLVDLGCGSGAYTCSVPGVFKARVGIDVARHKLAFARNAHGSATASYIAASVHDVPLATRSVDLVLCSEVVEHFPEPSAILKEIARILRPGAMLILSSPARLDIRALVQWMFGSRPKRSLRLRRPDMHGHYWYFAPDHLSHLIESAGFKVLSVRGVPKLHVAGLPRLLRWRLVTDQLLSRLGERLKSSIRFRTLGAFLIVEARRVD